MTATAEPAATEATTYMVEGRLALRDGDVPAAQAALRRAVVLSKVWGLGSETTKDPGPWEGEQRNMWKPTQQPGLWFHGGNLHQSRHYSLYLALQLKARYEGIPTPVYGLQEVHHLS